MPVPESLLYLTEADVRQTMSVPEAVELAEGGIRADATGQVTGDKFYMPVGEAGFVKSFAGYLNGEKQAFVKTFSYFPGNPRQFGRPATSSVVLLFDAETGLPTCLMEAGWITALKTGASTAVTASYLARPESAVVTIFGAGSLGQMHLRALVQRFALRQAFVVDVLPQAAESYAAVLGAELGLPVQPVPLTEREQAVQQSDVVVTVTTGDMVLVERAWLKPGAFVARLGSYQEVALDVITGVDKTVVDNWSYVRPRIPELEMLAADGRFSFEDVYAEWPEIVAGRKPGRESADEVIAYMALGIWGEYAAILPEAYRRAKDMGLGQHLGPSVTGG